MYESTVLNQNMVFVTEKEQWDEIINKCQDVDFYHTYDYHQLSKGNSNEPVLFRYEQDDLLIALPLLISDIEGTNYKDAHSVYGYCGPVTNSNSEISAVVLADFRKKLNVFLKNNKIIAVFSRLHPYLSKQQMILAGLGEIKSNGMVVNIDVTKNMEWQWKQYSRRLRSYVNKSKQIYTIKKGVSIIDIEAFVSMYHENMRRVSAKPFYFFNKDFFKKLLNSPDIKAELYLAIDKESGNIAGGAIFTKKNGIVQYHLSGVKEAYLKDNPIKLLINNVREEVTIADDFKYFNLGGGLGGSEIDDLFRFKSGFSKDFKPFYLWNYIVDDEIYWDLVQKRNFPENVWNKNEELPSFFPLYRLAINS